MPLGYGGTPGAARATPESALRERLGLGDGPIVLNVAMKKVHKNQLRVWCRRCRASARPCRTRSLVLAGASTPYEAELRAEAAPARASTARSPSRATSTTPTSRASTRWRPRSSFPSLNEGFGLPVLEAMARGVPSSRPSALASPRWPAMRRCSWTRRRSTRSPTRRSRVLTTPGCASGWSRRGRASRRVHLGARRRGHARHAGVERCAGRPAARQPAAPLARAMRHPRDAQATRVARAHTVEPLRLGLRRLRASAQTVGRYHLASLGVPSHLRHDVLEDLGHAGPDVFHEGTTTAAGRRSRRSIDSIAHPARRTLARTSGMFGAWFLSPGDTAA